MITAAQALSFDRLKDAPPPIEIPKLTIEQDADLEYVDSIVENIIYSHFDGKMLSFPVPSSLTLVLEALRKRYESGGWTVGLFPQRKENDDVEVINIVLAPTGAMQSTIEKPKGLPRLDELTPHTTATFATTSSGAVVELNRRLLVRMPTRGRPEQALRVLKEYRDNAGCPITLEVVIDEDDATMMAPIVLQRLNALGCVITVGLHKSKVEAVNGGRVSEWDILLLASDDMVPCQTGYAVEVLRSMEEHWPHLDGALFFDDGYAHGRCCTLPIIGRRFYERFGYVYEPEYRSLVCDVEQTELWTSMGRLTYVPKKIIEHRHHVTGARKDALYERNDALHDVDKQVYQSRKDRRRYYAQWAFDAPPMWLSICIATVPSRRVRLERLLEHLYAQMFWESRKAEIVIDEGEGTIGAKRQRLLERAKGHFVSFVDDDDWVSHDYVKRIMHAIESAAASADCVRLVGTMTTNGERPEMFEHSLKYDKWVTEEGIHKRTPNHLNPVRRTLALQAGFPVDVSHGEDKVYSDRLFPLLKKEADAGDESLYLYWFRKKGTIAD